MNLRKLREKTGLNQNEFWSRIGVSQSSGSRLENENRDLSEPLRRLIIIAYGEPKESRQVIEQIRQ